MKKSVKIIIAVLVVVFIGCFVGEVLYHKHVLEQQQAQQVFMSRAISYSRDLTIDTGAYDIAYNFNAETGECDDDLLYNFTILEPQRVYVRVVYYRLETGSTATYDDVINSYIAYLNKNDEGASIMREFHMSRVNNNYAVVNGEEIREDDFEYLVFSKVKELYGVPYYNASFEQLDDAIEAIVSDG